ncbi:hypothetical protein PN498_18580 [Oscillatoria sp. CS-180]|uniref:hypothetical protein n=1 Tax=Oscillatoria sp. CS-180 TaxID=3021720 RepID=UPI00232BA201|nr:hypothetical protein [Oscillatoria sp. CS-180]MDB9528007.1 hypothetical protein [Oscillatoria sp. CS-180]
MQQSNSLDFKLVQRVCLLQQALDQALGSLDELTAQVRDKQWVETQLANTEKYANVQQQAIAHLKQQLAQFTEVQNHLLSVMGYRLNELIDHQQQEFDYLNIQFHQTNAELQGYLQYLGQQQQSGKGANKESPDYQLALEAEVMVARSMSVNLSQHLSAAKQHLTSLKSDLGGHHTHLSQIIKTIQAMIADLEAFQETDATTQADSVEEDANTRESMSILDPEDVMDSVGDGDADTGVLEMALHRQEHRIHELEAMLMDHVEQEAQLRQRYQAVAAERDRYKRELHKLRQIQTVQSSATADPSVAQNRTHRARRRSQPSQPIQPLKLPNDPS